MRNYTHVKGGLSKIEFDEDSGEFVAKIVPVLPEPELPDTSEDTARNVDDRPFIAELIHHAIAAE